MITKLTVNDLILFENRVANAFNEGKIGAPVHLSSGNEEGIIQAFRDVTENDWVLCTWRSHYQCLLKGVPEDEVYREILSGRSISLCFPEYKVFSSALVGGVLPIATGIAMSIKKKNEKIKVHCFLGDMGAETGIAHECIKYSLNYRLPIRFIIEDNGQSVCTNTREAWNFEKLWCEDADNPAIIYFKYESKYPHAGAGVRVQF